MNLNEEKEGKKYSEDFHFKCHFKTVNPLKLS